MNYILQITTKHNLYLYDIKCKHSSIIYNYYFILRFSVLLKYLNIRIDHFFSFNSFLFFQTHTHTQVGIESEISHIGESLHTSIFYWDVPKWTILIHGWLVYMN